MKEYCDYKITNNYLSLIDYICVKIFIYKNTLTGKYLTCL